MKIDFGEDYLYGTVANKKNLIQEKQHFYWYHSFTVQLSRKLRSKYYARSPPIRHRGSRLKGVAKLIS